MKCVNQRWIIFTGFLLASFHAGANDAPISIPENAPPIASTRALYTVSYNSNGGTGGLAPIDLRLYSTGDTATLAANSGNLVRTNYIFKGWNTAADGSGESYVGSNLYIITSSNVTFYAQWIPTRTISFNANGGTGSMASQTVSVGGAVKLRVNTFTRSSYVFMGWATTASGAVACNDGQSFQIASSNVTLYAVWAPTSSLQVYYNFDSQSAIDLSGRGNHGTDNNMTYSDDGAGGYSAHFDGSSSFISLPTNLVKNSSSFTIMLRFKAVPSQYGVLFGYQNTAGGTTSSQFVPMLSIRSDGKLRGELWIGSQLEMISPSVVNDCQWHTVSLSAAPGAIKLNLDGVTIGSSTETVSHLSMSFNQIGVGQVTGIPFMPDPDAQANNIFYFDGLIDDFYFYNTAI